MQIQYLLVKISLREKIKFLLFSEQLKNIPYSYICKIYITPQESFQ